MQYFKFFDKNQGKDIDVAVEKWRWLAIYNDGTELRQFDDITGRFHQFLEIDQTKLKRFVMYADHTPRLYSIFFDPNTMKLIHFYRRVRLGGVDELKWETFYFFGFEKSIYDRTTKTIVFIDHLDNVHFADKSDLQLFD